MPKHKTIHVNIGDLEADIDEMLAPLVKEIWKAGISTANSCQENQPGVAWIEFFSSIDATEFLDIVAGEYSDEFDSLYNRIRGEWSRTSDPVQGKWQFDIHPVDMSIRQWYVDDNIDEKPTGAPEFIFRVSIRFPCTDINVLLQRMLENGSVV